MYRQIIQKTRFNTKNLVMLSKPIENNLYLCEVDETD